MKALKSGSYMYKEQLLDRIHAGVFDGQLRVEKEVQCSLIEV